jgi:glutaredoxin 3
MNFGFDPNVKSNVLAQPLTIYTSPGCPACTSAIKICKDKGIKCKVYNRKDHSEYVKKNTNNCQFVPNIFDANKKYLGGNDELIKLTKDLKDI